MIPNMVIADKKGNVMVHPSLKMMGMDFSSFADIRQEELIPMPKDSALLFLPGHVPVGFDEETQAPVSLKKFNNADCFPVAAFPIPGFTRVYLPAAFKLEKELILPLWPYTAVGHKNNKFYIAAFRVDNSIRQKPFYYKDISLLKKRVFMFENKFPKNRLVKHLAFCALNYNCRNAQNLFFGRWEAPLPVSPGCNARCLGCLSYQGSDCADASHERIRFVPQAEEIAEIAAFHLATAKNAIVSFGQGCEGEPLLEATTILSSIKLIRERSGKGMIHLNTNGSFPEKIKPLAKAGLNSIRISCISFSPLNYDRYYRPKGYGLKEVLSSIKQARECGLFVSVNLLTFPGFTDSRQETDLTMKFLKKGYVDLLQMRNLSIDAELFRDSGLKTDPVPIGMKKLFYHYKKIKKLKLGYFNTFWS